MWPSLRSVFEAPDFKKQPNLSRELGDLGDDHLFKVAFHFKMNLNDFQFRSILVKFLYGWR